MGNDKPKKLVRKAVSEKHHFIPNGAHIASRLSTYDKRPEASRLYNDWFNVSSLVYGDCVRAKLLASNSSSKGVNFVKPADRLLWAIGKAVEAHIRQNLLDLHGLSAFYGEWHCACGAIHYDGYGDKGRQCPSCLTKPHRYSEHLILNHDYMLTGSPDMLVDHCGKLTVLEIKSIKVGGSSGAPEFNSLEAPIRQHSLQALVYRKLLELAGIPVTDEVVIIYGAKDYVMKNPYKPFDIDATDRFNVRAVDQLLEVAKYYADSKREGSLVDRLPVCSSSGSTRAKNCPMCQQCFAV
jgi:hypothetical protein